MKTAESLDDVERIIDGQLDDRDPEELYMIGKIA